MNDNNTTMEVGERDGRVVLQFNKPVAWIAFEPQMAFEVGEKIARAAHGARFGEAPPSDKSYIAKQVRARVTEDTRDRLVARVAMMLHSLRETPKSDGEVAMHIVDTVLSGVA